MARRVFYRISDRPDGCFDAVVTMEPKTVVRRDGFASLAEAESWVEGLRVLMAALGAPVARMDEIDPRPRNASTTEGIRLPHGLRTAR